MKFFFMPSLVLTVLALSIGFIQITSCNKAVIAETKTDTIYKCVNSINGLWEGKYTISNGVGLPIGSSFYFSFTIYPDGTMGYKSKDTIGYLYYGNGTWTMSGNIFTYTVFVNSTNNPVGVQQTQTGTSTYSNIGTLTNGINKNIAPGPDQSLISTWSMTRVN